MFSTASQNLGAGWEIGGQRLRTDDLVKKKKIRLWLLTAKRHTQTQGEPKIDQSIKDLNLTSNNLNFWWDKGNDP